MRNRYRS